jgi:SAM-dependent methyltransferase
VKDYFSTDSKGYATFRPGYPHSLVNFILEQTHGRACAWDCATGNGQFAALLAPHFTRVEATDISANQLAHATQAPNIHYSLQPAESTKFPDASFDLITVAQAIHWFDFEGFYSEAKRVAKPDAVLAVIGYPLLSVNPTVDAAILPFYEGTIGEYWNMERRYIDERYRTIPFPFQEIEVPQFHQRYDWDFDQLLGYFNTWSAVKNYIAKHGRNPLELVVDALQMAWGEGERHTVTIPMIVRLGKIL